jgi:hypothetical protein
MMQFLAMIGNDNLKKAGEFVKDKIIVNLKAKALKLLTTPI